MPLTIVAHITASDGKEEFVFDELKKLIDVTRSEEGCIQYDLHRDNDQPAHFMFFENWQSHELWQAHMNAPHLKTFAQATEGAVADLTIHQMTNVG